MSCVYTIHKTPQTHQLVMTQDSARPITSAASTHHFGSLDPSLPDVDPSLRRLDPSTSVRLRSKSSGVELSGKENSGTSSVGEPANQTVGFVLSGKNQTTDPRAERPLPEGLPEPPAGCKWTWAGNDIQAVAQ
jgi:hypothetical protein